MKGSDGRFPITAETLCRCLTGPLLMAVLAAAPVIPVQQKPPSKLLRVSPSTPDKPRVDAKLLRRGTSVVVRAIITKSGRVANVEFVKGNADLMPDVRNALKNWKYKPYIYQGHPIEVETTIHINCDPLVGGQ
jgi:TonB family protein